MLFPKVDISQFEQSKDRVSEELGAAARDGFFYVVGHGLDDARIQRAFELGERWFQLPIEEKGKYKLDIVEYVGWKGEAMLRTGQPQLEQIIFGHSGAENSYANQLQEAAKKAIPGMEEFVDDFSDDLLRISTTILRGLAIALGEPEDLFIKGLDRSLPDLSGGGGFNHYLPFMSKSKATDYRIPAHADAYLLTLLFQREGQPGLEVTPGREFFSVANNGEPALKNYDQIQYPSGDVLNFTLMPPVKGAITVNVGDLLMRFSDGEYLSTYHRVVSPMPGNGIPEGDRYTMVYFAQPARSTLIKGPKQKWPPILAGDDTRNTASKHYSHASQAFWKTGTIPKQRITEYQENKA